MATELRTGLTAAEGRKFALTLAGAFVVFGALLWWRGRERVALAFAIIAALLLLAAFLMPGRLGPLYRSWMRIGLLMSKVTSPIALGIVYFVLITPVGAIMRAAGRNSLKRRRTDTFWLDRAPGERQSRLDHQF